MTIDPATRPQRASLRGHRPARRWPFGPEAAGGSLTGPQHEVNEDALALPDAVPTASAAAHGWLFAVADGVSSRQGGAAASAAACSGLFDAFYKADSNWAHDDDHRTDASTSAEDRLKEALAAADRTVRQWTGAVGDTESQSSASSASLPAAGTTSAPATTIVAAAIVGDEVWVAHVGDSRAFLVRRGIARPLTVDHTLVASLLERKALTPEEAEAHPHRNVLSRALGTDDSSPTLTARPLRPGDRLILATDGVTKLLTVEALALAAAAPSPEAAVADVLLRVERAGLIDDATVVVIDPFGYWLTRHPWLRPVVRSPRRLFLVAGVVVALIALALVLWRVRVLSTSDTTTPGNHSGERSSAGSTLAAWFEPSRGASVIAAGALS